MRSNWLLILLLFGVSLLMKAAPVDQERAELVARNFFAERSNGKPFFVAGTIVLGNGGQPLLYIFNGLPGMGFVMVSGDDGVYPVPGYSLTKSWQHDTTLLPPAVRFLLNEYLGQILQHIDYELPPTAEAIAAWAHYGASYPQFAAQTVATVAPLLGSIEWGQGCYYNDDCPSDLNAGTYLCNRVPVGCVATSMAMVMKYWQSPATGIGANSYVHPVYGTQSANFGASSYNWSQMPDVVTSTNAEVAEISFHAGVAVNMEYGPTGSGAYTSDARNALVNHFGFQSAATFRIKQNFTTPQWDSILKANLDQSRPVIYRGNNAVGADGHAWVIDGYQGVASNHYHCNWGWDGYLNGYFYLTSLTPGGSNFTYIQGAITDLVPVVTQPPVADFFANPTSAYIGTTISFTCISAGMPSAWKWYFGDGDSSTLQHPVHIYTQAGQYSVTLIAYNTMGSDTLTKTQYITITVPPLPIADFSASPLIAPAGSPVQFADLSHNAPLQWLWDFGDGQFSTVQHPQHIYQSVDTFTVKLLVTNGAGSDSIVKTDYIITTPPAPAAAFTASALFVYPGDTIWFTDLSLHNPFDWLWSFGNGDTSHLQNPWYVYTLPGVYSITLKVANANGTSELTKFMYIYVLPLPPNPKAWFASDITHLLVGDSVLFNDYSFSQPNRWEWSFPGGIPSTSTDQNPGRITYPNYGVYDVQLIVWNITGSDTLLRKDFIHVGAIGIQQAAADIFINLYPVPAGEYLYVEGSEKVTGADLFDISGRLVRSWIGLPTEAAPVRLNLSGIPHGTYRIRLTGDTFVRVKPLLIAR
jgi:PKD repeat protein